MSLFYLFQSVNYSLFILLFFLFFQSGNGDSATFLIAVILSFSAVLATFCFLCWNTFLMLKNLTTVEASGGIFKKSRVGFVVFVSCRCVNIRRDSRRDGWRNE